MNPLITPSWLAARLAEPTTEAKTVILDATLPPVGVVPAIDTFARYLETRLPGAIFFDIDALSDSSSPYPHMLPSAEDFGRAMSDLGISDTDTIVVYEQAGIFSSPRARWMLRVFGASEVYLLDGGIGGWLAAGMPTESGPVQSQLRRSGKVFTASMNRNAVQDLEQLRQSLANHQQVLDARSSGRFDGTAPEPRPNLSSGHMPGAVNIPFTDLVADGRLKPAAKLKDIFDSKHVDLGQPITTSCGSGVTAAVIALGLEIVGAKQVRLYDGSWAEYAQQPDAAIEKAG